MESLKGSLLIAAPSLVDPNFARTVVLIAEHNEEGALGLVLNRPAETNLASLWENISGEATESEAKAFIGGPVQKNAVLILHGHADLAPEVEPIVPGVYLAGEVDILKTLLEREPHDPKGPSKDPKEPAAAFRVFCGYSGWGAGQLDGEMKAGGWLTFPATAAHVFQESPDRLWNTTIRSLGGVYELFAMMPLNPEMN